MGTNCKHTRLVIFFLATATSTGQQTRVRWSAPISFTSMFLHRQAHRSVVWGTLRLWYQSMRVAAGPDDHLIPKLSHDASSTRVSRQSQKSVLGLVICYWFVQLRTLFAQATIPS